MLFEAVLFHLFFFILEVDFVILMYRAISLPVKFFHRKI